MRLNKYQHLFWPLNSPAGLNEWEPHNHKCCMALVGPENGLLGHMPRSIRAAAAAGGIVVYWNGDGNWQTVSG